jgi:ABC-type Fe3+/spermidine/putrescine transport system ATPase subunit
VARFVGQMNFLDAIAGERAGWARVAGAEVRHGATEPVAAGTRLTLAIRPEEITVGAAPEAENRLVTRIRAIQFLGSFTRLSLVLPDGAPALECDVAATAFAALGAVEGSELALSLRPEALRVFPAAG